MYRYCRILLVYLALQAIIAGQAGCLGRIHLLSTITRGITVIL